MSNEFELYKKVILRPRWFFGLFPARECTGYITFMSESPVNDVVLFLRFMGDNGVIYKGTRDGKLLSGGTWELLEDDSFLGNFTLEK
jgi:hypothetical protein